MDDAQIEQFTANLISWYDQFQRDLPWRAEPSLYKTIVSEFMLQQTRVSTVLPYFANWLEKFPNIAALAKASEEDVLKAWEGLGYYSRARNLHKLAKQLNELDTIPQDPKSWIKFPGIGPYSSATVTSIAFGYPVACVDGNVVRIISRILGIEDTFKDSASASKQLQSDADRLLNNDRPGDHNQAMMELGATICHKHKPLCTVCPVLSLCQAGQKGNPENFPKFIPKKTIQRTVERLFLIHDKKLLLQKYKPHASRLANVYELPERSLLPPISDPNLLKKAKRGISNEMITEMIYSGALSSAVTSIDLPDCIIQWVPLDQLANTQLSAPHKRWIKQLHNDQAKS